MHAYVQAKKARHARVHSQNLMSPCPIDNLYSSNVIVSRRVSIFTQFLDQLCILILLLGNMPLTLHCKYLKATVMMMVFKVQIWQHLLIWQQHKCHSGTV